MRAPVTTDIGSLVTYGFPPELLSVWAGAIPALNALQLDAINNFRILEGDHLVVSAPTSSGKTMIGELAALKGALERQRALFLLPLKALVNDKHQQFTRIYGAFGLRIIQATGETIDDIPALMRGQYDICLMTYEKFAVLVLGSPHILGQVGTVVVDEVQMVADKSRGVNLEFILTLLRMRPREGFEPQLIALSAVIGDTNGLERWLGARLLRRDERPVPLNEGVIRFDGSYRYLDPAGEEKVLTAHIQPQMGEGSGQDLIIPLVRKLVTEGKQVIVFRETRPIARSCARYLAKALSLPPAQEALDALPAGDPSIASALLRETLAHGVAFHISDLDREERLVIEEQFRAPNTRLRVIVAITTLKKSSKYKEPQAWMQALAQQRVAPSVMRALQRRVHDQHQATLRAKKAAACLYWVTDLPLAQIEQALMQFDRLDGAAGPIRSVASRSCDLLPTVTRVAELLHPELDLSERLKQLLTRLEVGVPAAAVELAAHTGARLRRGDYQRLIKAGLCVIDTIEVSDDDALLACLENNATKLAAVRRAVKVHRDQEREQATLIPAIPMYEG